MIAVRVRRSRDLDYLVRDAARELEGVRDGSALRWRRGEVDLTSEAGRVELLSGTPRARVVGYDLIVAAPRMVSALVALDDEVAPAVVRAHRDAVDQSLDYLEAHALVTRDRRDGDDVDRPGRWASVAMFTHGVNRHWEPHLHDHVVVGARLEGASTVLDSRALYAHLPAADALYRSSLRDAVARETPYRVWRSFERVEHVVGLDEGYRALWGGHHAERTTKMWPTRDEIREKWAHDLTRYESHGQIAAPWQRDGHLFEHAFSAALEGRDRVGRRDVVAAWADAAVFGTPARDVATAVDTLASWGEGRGVREGSTGVRDVRMIAQVRERGPRPLLPEELEQWRQRSRDRSRVTSRER